MGDKDRMFVKGMDISFLDEIEQSGGVFSEDGLQKDCLKIMKDNGVNAIRLRIWNEPPGGYCDLKRTLVMAKRIKEWGFRFLLDFHYSDQWADPAKQYKPKAWENLSFEELKDAVYVYTTEVLQALRNQGTLPDMVQIGNEITPGMLWDEGRVNGEGFDTEEQWNRLADLVKEGIRAAQTVSPDIGIMIHIDRGGDHAGARYFFDRLEECRVPFDTIGLSYYPWWHGTLEDLRANLNDLAERYDRDIVVVETAYPWAIEEKKGLSFILHSEEQLHAGYPATVEGQAAYLQEVISIVRQVPNGRGLGFYWWEPCWIPSKTEWSVGHDNNWSNLTLFDYRGRKLSSLEVLKTI